MSTVIYTPMSRDEVLSYLGPHWPALAGATVLRITTIADVTDGALSVYPAEGEPGTTWWVVDGLVVPQDAGPPPDLPGEVPETVPESSSDIPPITHDIT
ncbi:MULTISPECIES: hypothetical protein [unclassified Streptomyces]|uniref:hypothetical protein n=1 Tax=unclassified Streptomyces TaxID=2593676 RepID=UPI0033D09AC6